MVILLKEHKLLEEFQKAFRKEKSKHQYKICTIQLKPTTKYNKASKKH